MLSQKYFIFFTKDGLEVPSFEIGSIITKPILPRATRVIKHINIEGRDGTLTEDTGAYNNIEINIQLINYKDNLLDKEVLGLLDGTGGELKLSWLQGYYDVKEVSNFTITEEVEGVFNIELTFICGPYRCLDNELIEVTANNTNISIIGNSKANHITTIYGNGDISLLINGEQINFKDVEEYITIDTARMICYKDNTVANNKMVGEFTKLSPGLNNISWIGNINKIAINYRGRFLN